MSDFKDIPKRIRGKTLLIVEGNHEKNTLFSFIFKVFPEINISMEDVWIYGTNIYSLFSDIEREYGQDWYIENGYAIDIDLPFVISRKRKLLNPFELIRYKDEFTDIILVFDYEHHDPNFSKEKILIMQKFFDDSANMGKLYINYPMIESYKHLYSLPDMAYEYRKVSTDIRPGRMYKEYVESIGFAKKIKDYMHLPERLEEILSVFCIKDRKICYKYLRQLLEIKDYNNLKFKISLILDNFLEDDNTKCTSDDIMELNHHLYDIISRSNYFYNRISYWDYMREFLKNIIYHNVCKANKIQNGIYKVDKFKYREVFENIDYIKIVKEQNKISSMSDGYIWVLNTSVFLLADYNFSLII